MSSKFLTLNPAPWATNGNYPAGGNPWNGTPIRVTPSAGIAAAGFAPQQQPPAQIVNYEFGVLGDAVSNLGTYAAHAALQTWRKFSIPVTGTTAYSELVGMAAIRTVGQTDIARAPCAFGPNPSDSSKTYMARSSDGSDWEAAPAALNTTSFPSVAWSSAGQPGAMFVGQASPQIAYTLDHGHAWTQTNFSAGNNVMGHYAELSGVAHYFIATAVATVYATTNLPAFGSGPSFFTLLSSGNALAAGSCEFADDATANVILVGRVNGQSFPTIYWTANAGTSWTKVQDLSASATTANVTYNKANAKFVAWDDAGGVWTSPTGQTWTQIAGNATLSNGFAQGLKTMCSAGPAIIKRASNVGFAGSFVQDGIAYSFDLGATWNFWYMAFAPVINKIRGFNNRVYVLDSNALWVSGQLGYPTNEL